MISIEMLSKIDFKNYTFIEGFPGLGLVGPMSISYMIEKLGMKYVGYIDSDMFPPIIAIHASKPMKPIRIYQSEKFKIITIFAEIVIPVNMIYELSDKLYSFIKKGGIDKIISISGIPSQVANKSVFAISSTDQMLKSATSAGLKPVVEGVSIGVSALMLGNSVADKIQNLNILVPIENGIADPKYAAIAIEVLNKITKVNIDTEELDKEAKIVEEKIREMLQKSKDTHEDFKKSSEDPSPPMYV